MPTEITEKRFVDEVWRFVASSPGGISKDDLEERVTQRLKLRTKFPYEFWMLVENLLLPSLVIDSDETVRPNLPAGILYHSGGSQKLPDILNDGLVGRYHEDRPATVFLSDNPSTSFTFGARKKWGSFMVEVNRETSERLGSPIVTVGPTGRYDEASNIYGAHNPIPPQAMRTIYLVGKQKEWIEYLSSEVRYKGFDLDIVENPGMPGGMNRIVATHHAWR
ncbi:MAG: hypothetical protein HYS62_02245 [Candidatus Aenigmarchaeota archaeon]|nr:hypothetical protein [Candidatus Aenigmarchaeota archaeon]